MTQTVELILRLYDGDPKGGRTWWDGDFFLSVVPLPAGENVNEALLHDVGAREALFLLQGEDPATPLPLLYLCAGEVASTFRELSAKTGAKGTTFNRLLLLGAPQASAQLPLLERDCRLADAWSLLNVADARDARLCPNDVWTCCRQRWSRLFAVAGLTCPGVTESGNRKAVEGNALEEDGALSSRRDRDYFCNGRGADARARLENRGLRILAGSRSSPLDATPSLCPAFRETIKQLVEAEKLQKIDGIWTFVEDVRMVSSVQAASILMRTAAGADAWKTADGVPLTTALQKGKKA